MNNLDKQYLNLLRDILNDGEWEENRTGIRAKTIPSAMIRHDMAEGFPMLTIKKVPFKTMAVELEGFINGITSKKWYQERGCKIWNEWCNPQKVAYSTDPEIQKLMAAEDDLGLIYGAQWRDFHDPMSKGCLDGYWFQVDQFQKILNTLKDNPQDRRMICSAWNPLAFDKMALPPCHVLWQVSVINGKLNLTWFQRSCDLALGIPFNIASYGLLLHLLAKESGYEEGILTGFLNNVHYYENQLDGVREILYRETDFDLPRIETESFTSIFDWTHKDSKLINYQSLSTVKMPVAV